MEEKLAGSRLYAENKTLGSRVKVHAEINDMQKSLFGTVPDRWLWNYAHAVVEEQLDRTTSPRWFALRLLIAVMKAALHWNGRLSPEMKTGLTDLWRRFRNRAASTLIQPTIYPKRLKIRHSPNFSRQWIPRAGENSGP